MAADALLHGAQGLGSAACKIADTRSRSAAWTYYAQTAALIRGEEIHPEDGLASPNPPRAGGGGARAVSNREFTVREP